MIGLWVLLRNRARTANVKFDYDATIGHRPSTDHWPWGDLGRFEVWLFGRRRGRVYLVYDYNQIWRPYCLPVFRDLINIKINVFKRIYHGTWSIICFYYHYHGGDVYPSMWVECQNQICYRVNKHVYSFFFLNSPNERFARKNQPRETASKTRPHQARI